MTYCCAICQVTTGEIKEGKIRKNQAVPTCAEHFASIYWRSRQPTTLPLALDSPVDYFAKQTLLQAAGG